jgi:uncharacterized protein (DUF1697 family)
MMRSNMIRQVALLRGINNAGKGTRVAMADLRKLFEALGFRDVRTLLNSGNVVFTGPARGGGDALARIEKALASRLEVTAPVTLLSAEQVAAAVRENPFGDVAGNPSHLLVVVPLLPLRIRGLKPLLKQPWGPEALALGTRVAYLWCANGVARSPLWAAVERTLERSCTARNIATMTKLMAALERRLD